MITSQRENAGKYLRFKSLQARPNEDGGNRIKKQAALVGLPASTCSSESAPILSLIGC